ncbi:MAG: hypothetical protein WEE50_06990 [Chloroflexota bacterium]
MTALTTGRPTEAGTLIATKAHWKGPMPRLQSRSFAASDVVYPIGRADVERARRLLATTPTLSG